jgi:hypothetical protein
MSVLYECSVKCKSVSICQKKYGTKFAGVQVLYRNIIQILVIREKVTGM